MHLPGEDCTAVLVGWHWIMGRAWHIHGTKWLISRDGLAMIVVKGTGGNYSPTQED